MSLPQKILFAAGFLLFLLWFMPVMSETRRKDLTLGSVETLFVGLGLSLIGISASLDDNYTILGLAFFAIGIPVMIAYVVEKRKKRCQ